VQTLIEIDTCHCLMVSEPERLAHSPSTRLGVRLGLVHRNLGGQRRQSCVRGAASSRYWQRWAAGAGTG